jgi:bla regulator protein BlaR1
MISEKIQTPVTFGYWNPVVLLPRKVTEYLNDTSIEHILLHELTHVKRHDIAFCWIASFITIIHWFNPAVWLALNSMRKNLEIACDADALNYLQKNEYPNYGKTLITLSDNTHCSQRSNLVVGILENHNDLKERITMITQAHKHGFKSRFLIILASSFIALTAIAQPRMSEDTNNIPEAKDPNTIELSAFASKAERDLKKPILVGQQWHTTKYASRKT